MLYIPERVVYLHCPEDEELETSMKFRLTYEGEIPSSPRQSNPSGGYRMKYLMDYAFCTILAVESLESSLRGASDHG